MVWKYCCYYILLCISVVNVMLQDAAGEYLLSSVSFCSGACFAQPWCRIKPEICTAPANAGVAWGERSESHGKMEQLVRRDGLCMRVVCVCVCVCVWVCVCVCGYVCVVLDVCERVWVGAVVLAYASCLVWSLFIMPILFVTWAHIKIGHPVLNWKTPT